MLEQAYDTGSDAWLRAQGEASDDAYDAHSAHDSYDVSPGEGLASDEPLLPWTSFDEAPAYEASDPAHVSAAPSGPDWSEHDPQHAVGAAGATGAAGAAGAGAAGSGRRRAGRRAAPREGISPLGAIAGALVAVAGVALAIGALLLVRGDAPQGSPTVAGPDGVTSPSASPTSSSASVPPGEPTTGATTAPAPPTTPVAPATPTAASTRTTAARPAVTVLNNSRRTNLAARAAERFADGGWSIRQTGNFTGQISQTTVYYLPGQEAAARSFARQFGIPRVLPRFERLPGQGFTVVLTRDYDA